MKCWLNSDGFLIVFISRHQLTQGPHSQSPSPRLIGPIREHLSKRSSPSSFVFKILCKMSIYLPAATVEQTKILVEVSTRDFSDDHHNRGSRASQSQGASTRNLIDHDKTIHSPKHGSHRAGKRTLFYC